MIPKEHGGWAMLLIPYIVGLGVAGGFRPESALFLLTIVLAFMASKPLGILVRTWRSKSRWKNAAASAAPWWLGAYFLSAALSAVALVLVFQLWWTLLFGLLGVAFLGIQALVEGRKMDRTTLGELVGAFGLSLSAPGAYYVTTENLGFAALLLWLLTALHSAGSVFYINMRLRHHLARNEQKSILGRLELDRDTIAYLILLLAVLLGLSYLGHLPLLAFVAFLPLVCRTVAAVYEARPQISFKRLGLVELANALAFAALVILSYAVY